jgi:hypothetical protein
MTPEAIKTMCKAIALVVFVTGAFGSVLCLPYAIGWDLRLIAVSGIYFIAGAVMIVGGLFTYAYLVTQK